jgi:hypothetical protein
MSEYTPDLEWESTMHWCKICVPSLVAVGATLPATRTILSYTPVIGGGRAD